MAQNRSHAQFASGILQSPTIVVKIRLMDTTERSQERTQPSTCSFTRVTVDFPHVVAIARPLVLAVIDRRVRQLQHVVAAVFIRINHCRLVRDGFGQNALTGRLVAVGDYPTTFFATLPADHVNDWRAVVIIGIMPGCLLARRRSGSCES